MKRVLLMLILVALMALPVIAQNKNIYARPSSRWGEGSYSDPLWNWLKWADPLVQSAGSGSNPGIGDILYVDSNVSNAGNGGSWSNATATLNAAINLASANDTIYIAQGHTETMGVAADEVDVDVDGLTIEQIGNNTVTNGFDYTDDEAFGAFAISGDNVTLINLRFHANVPDVNDAVQLEANATGVSFINCLFDAETPGTDEFFRCITQDGANTNRLTITGCEFRMGAGAAQCAIDLIDSDYSRITGNTFSGDYSVADVNNATTASIWLTIAGNEIINGTVGGAAGLNEQPCIELKADTSGMIVGNVLACNEATPDAAVVGADTYLYGNTYNETEGGVSAAPMWFNTDTLDNKVGVDDASNLGTTANVTADSDGSILERLEQIDVDTSAMMGYALPRYIACSTADFTASADDLFLVAGGPIEIISFFGICTTLAAGAPGDLKIWADATTADQDRDFSTTVTVDTLAAGDSVKFTNVIDEGVLNFTANTGAGQQLSWICPIGTIETLLTSTGTGAVTWYMVYRPLTASSAVTAAP